MHRSDFVAGSGFGKRSEENGKTLGYHARMNGVDLALIMSKLNHNSLVYTKR